MQIVGIPNIPAAITATEVPGMFRQRQRWVWGSVGTGWTLLSRLIQDTSGCRPYQLAILWFMIYECWLVIDYDRFSHVFRHPLKHPCAFVNSRTPLRSKSYCLCVRNARMLRKARLKKVMLRPWWSLEWIRGGNSWDEFRWPTSRTVGTSKSWFGWRTEDLWQVLVQRGDGLWITRQAFWFLFFGFTLDLQSLFTRLGPGNCRIMPNDTDFLRLHLFRTTQMRSPPEGLLLRYACRVWIIQICYRQIFRARQLKLRKPWHVWMPSDAEGGRPDLHPMTFVWSIQAERRRSVGRCIKMGELQGSAWRKVNNVNNIQVRYVVWCQSLTCLWPWGCRRSQETWSKVGWGHLRFIAPKMATALWCSCHILTTLDITASVGSYDDVIWYHKCM